MSTERVDGAKEAREIVAGLSATMAIGRYNGSRPLLGLEPVAVHVFLSREDSREGRGATAKSGGHASVGTIRIGQISSESTNFDGALLRRDALDQNELRT